jgi:phage terminase large subunit-like protein
MKGLAKRKLIAPHVANVRSTNGEQEIEFTNGSRIMFGARESGFGRGFDDVDVIVFDEAQILTQKALDDMIPAANVAVNPLIIYIGTPPKPTDPSEVFTTRRAEALAVKEKILEAGLTGLGDTLFVEVSADPDADPDDRAQWRKGNPSFPERTPEHAILRMQLNLGPESFRREGLGIWDDAGVLNGVFDQVEWAKSRDTHRGLTVTMPTGPVSVGVGFSPDHQWATVGWAWESDGWTFADVVRHQGTDWVLPYLVERASRRNIKTVAVDQAGPAGTLLAAMGAAKLPVRTAATAEWKTACADLANLVHLDRFVHRGDDALNNAAARAQWRQVGDGRVFARRDSGVPIDPLEAVAAAVWGLTPDPKLKEFFMVNLNDFA